MSGGVDGLTVVGAIIDASGKWLVNGGFLVLEVGIDQVDAVAERMADADFVVHELIVDGDGDRRGVCAARAQ